MGTSRPASKLRGELTEFVGRRSELAQVRDALGRARLVTVSGPGGIGKTRLALQAASGARRAFRDGAWLAELGGLGDPALLVPEVARSLGLSDKSSGWAVAKLSDYLESRQLLLVLDQCEHLADACAVIADALLRSCQDLRIIATSRHVLGVPGEVVITVPPMTVPLEDRSDPPAHADELLQYEAVRLFVDRAAAVLPGFTLDSADGPAVAAVCRRLDGIPLAIELAAVRLRSLSLEQIQSRLDSRLALLSRGGAADVPHHRTMQATLAWSYGLLTDAEQALWRRVSVFAGSFDLDAAEAVCAGGEISTEAVVDLIDGLVSKSILSRSPGTAKVRYRLLGTIAEFGLRELRAQGDELELRRRHLLWFAAMAAKQDAFGQRRAAWIAALDADHDNLRAALAHCLTGSADPRAGAELACDLWRYWEARGHLTEGRRVLAMALERLDEDDPVRARAEWVAGFLALVQADLASARALLEAGLAAASRSGHTRTQAYAASQLGYVLYLLGNADQGRALAETALELHQRVGDQIGVALALTQMGFIELCFGQAHAAAELFARCEQVCAASGNLWYQGYAQWGLGVATFLLAHHQNAARMVSAALRVARCMEDPIGVALCLDGLAWIASSRHQAVRALVLLGAADATWAAIPAELPAPLRKHHDATLAAARQALTETRCAAELARGAAMSQADAIACALGESSRSDPHPVPAEAVPHQLTAREQDVAALVARGLSNGQVAATLVISVRTVESHVQHIMDKLGFNTRAEIAAWSAASAAQRTATASAR